MSFRTSRKVSVHLSFSASMIPFAATVIRFSLFITLLIAFATR